MGQLALALKLADHASFETFVAGANAAAVRHVAAIAAGASDVLWLWGPPGSGKTHLLQAACRAASTPTRAMYVPLAEVDASLLAGLEAVDLLALDDVQRVAGSAEWERALFVLLNEFVAHRGALLISAQTPAAGAGFALPDLRSRAAAAIAYRLEPLTDEQRATALRLHAHARGLELGPAEADYLLKRVDRDMRSLTAWLDRLDRDSLAEQRRLTIPFIRERVARESPAGD